MYSNETDIRKILMFLVDKLPRDLSGGADDSSASTGEGKCIETAFLIDFTVFKIFYIFFLSVIHGSNVNGCQTLLQCD